MPISTFIRLHIEKKYDFDYDKALTDKQKAISWAAEKMCEDHVYWIAMHERWVPDTNFNKGPAKFFDVLPAPVRPFIKSMVRKNIRKSLHAHGMGRHNNEEMAFLGERAISCIATLMADNQYFMGETPCGADATIYAFLNSAACPVFQSHLRETVEKHRNLMAYLQRMTLQYFPDLENAA